MDDFVAGAIARGRENPSWTPLESNPDALNQFAAGIGLEPSFQFSDCFGLDEDLLGFLPQPVVAFVLLFPFDNPAIARAKQELEEKLAKSAQPAVKDVFWMEQSIGERKRKKKEKKNSETEKFGKGNACGTIAVVHSILNNLDTVSLAPDSLLAKYHAAAVRLSPRERGHLLGGWHEIKQVHVEAAEHCVSNQTSAPAPVDNVNSHFVSFVLRDNHIVELDGAKSSHVVHAPSTKENFLRDCAAVIKDKYFALDPNGNFSIIVLAKAVAN